ncbi:MAG: DUF3300 domain-containing protein [Burkholderiales bacterium]|jgi:hypothetical protein|nr:DUF3300 domain-containing protein [Burkholderiales bacterium]
MKLHFLSQLSAGCRGALIVATAGCMLAAAPVWAQNSYNVAGAPEAQQAAEISQEMLDGLLAPIALYPDALLAQVLMAATYPMDVIEAARWQRDNPGLNGQALQDALDQFDWDPSVKSLATVPQVLQYMNDEPRWMQDLGQIVIADQPRVMESVQALRQKAYAAGSLLSNDKQTVNFETNAANQSYITIVPASPQVIYVPVYDPMVVYGIWGWPSRPVYWGPPAGVGFSAGFYWGAGFYPSIALWGGFNWGFGMLTINAPIYSSYYRRPPPMMGPRNSWRRPYPSHSVRPPAPRRPSYAPGSGNSARAPAGPSRPGKPPNASRPPNAGGSPNVNRPQGTNNTRPPAVARPPSGGNTSGNSGVARPLTPGNASSGAAPSGRPSGGPSLSSGGGARSSAGQSVGDGGGGGGGGGGGHGGGGGGGRGGR